MPSEPESGAVEDLDALLLDEAPSLGERPVGRGVGAALDDLDRMAADLPGDAVARIRADRGRPVLDVRREGARDRRLVDAGERSLAGREDADLDRLTRSLAGLGGPARVGRSARIGRRRGRRGGRASLVAAATAAGCDSGEGERQNGDEEQQPLACLSCASPFIPPFLVLWTLRGPD